MNKEKKNSDQIQNKKSGKGNSSKITLKSFEKQNFNLKEDDINLKNDSILDQNEKINEETEKNKTEENKIEQPQKKKKSFKLGKYAIYVGIILALTIVALYFSLANNFDDVINSFINLKYDYFVYGVLCFIGIFIINSLILYLFARRYKKRYYFNQGMANDAIGFFYNSITPAQTGGQIMQAYTYKKQGIPISNAISCLVMNFIVYQAVLILFATFSIIYTSVDPNLQFIYTAPAFSIGIGENSISFPLVILIVLGFIVEFFSVGIVVIMAYWKGFHNLILNKGVNFLHRIHIIKDPERSRRKLSVQVDSFKIELKNLFANPRFLILIIILNFASLALRYVMPYFLNIAVIGDVVAENVSYNYDIFDTITLTSIHKLITELIPIPGGAGISEYFYYQFFISGYQVTGNGDMVPGMLSTAQILWRTITFHIPLLISGIISAFYRGSPSKDEVENVENNSVTYLTLQIQTIDERKLTYNTLYQTRLITKVKKKVSSFSKNKPNKNKKSSSNKTKINDNIDNKESNDLINNNEKENK